MINYLSITSRSQGQIFGAKPSIEEFERQLEAEPTYKACNKLRAIMSAFAGTGQPLKSTTGKLSAEFHKHIIARLRIQHWL